MLKKSLHWKIVALLMLVSLVGCAAPSPATPPVIAAPVKLTPLPLSVQKIDSTPSQDYSRRVSNWLSKVEGLSSGETPK